MKADQMFRETLDRLAEMTERALTAETKARGFEALAAQRKRDVDHLNAVVREQGAKLDSLSTRTIDIVFDGQNPDARFVGVEEVVDGVRRSISTQATGVGQIIGRDNDGWAMRLKVLA